MKFKQLIPIFSITSLRINVVCFFIGREIDFNVYVGQWWFGSEEWYDMIGKGRKGQLWKHST